MRLEEEARRGRRSRSVAPYGIGGGGSAARISSLISPLLNPQRGRCPELGFPPRFGPRNQSKSDGSTLAGLGWRTGGSFPIPGETSSCPLRERAASPIASRRLLRRKPESGFRGLGEGLPRPAQEGGDGSGQRSPSRGSARAMVTSPPPPPPPID